VSAGKGLLVNEPTVGEVIGVHTGRDPGLQHRSGTRDVVFTFSTDTLADAGRREFSFTSDQALLTIRDATDRVRRVVVANPWRSGPAVALRVLMSPRQEAVRVDGTAFVRPLRLRRRDPTAVPALRESYQRYDRILERRVRRLGLISPAVLTFNPFVAAFCPMPWASSVTYYAQDDWASYPPVRPWWPAYRESYRALCEKGTRIICISDELASRVVGNAPVVVQPNGIVEAQWDTPLPPPPAVSAMARPIVAYVGTIDGRLDTGLIAEMAGDGAVGSVAFIGPLHDSDITAKLRSIPKVTLCGPMSRAELAGALMYSDVCIIPHVINSLTRAMSPMKLYEYLAAGKPVATTDIPAVHGVSDRVIVAAADNFPKAVRAALELPSLGEDERLQFVRSNSWAARHGRTLRVMLAEDADWWQV
jgi:glycosyltransferase involved in cell wall biosynthesis